MTSAANERRRPVVSAPTYEGRIMFEVPEPISDKNAARQWQIRLAPGVRCFVTLSDLTFWRVEGLAGLDHDRICLGGVQRAANEASRQVRQLARLLTANGAAA